MKIKRTYLWGILLAAMLPAGCTNREDLLPDAQQAAAPVAVSLWVTDAGRTTSRTSVETPDFQTKRGKQHVTRVQLYIYQEQKQKPGSYAQVATENVDWPHWEGAPNGLDTQAQKYMTRFQKYELNGKYLFFAAGFDDTYQVDKDSKPIYVDGKPVYNEANSVRAFGQPDKLAKEGDLFGNGYFTLQPQVQVNVLNHSELFAGGQVYTYDALKGGKIAAINLYRRVAGVEGFFRNVPAGVAKVELRLYQGQNTEVPFLPVLPDGYTESLQVPDKWYKDYRLSPSKEEGGNVLAAYQPTGKEPEGKWTLSAYLLPSQPCTDKDQTTLQLALLDAQGKVFNTRRILYKPAVQTAESRNGTGIIGPSDENSHTHYPIRANHYYCIGNSENYIDLGGNSEIYLTIDPVWDEYYGGAMDNDFNGSGIDKGWGDHDGGNLDEPLKP